MRRHCSAQQGAQRDVFYSASEDSEENSITACRDYTRDPPGELVSRLFPLTLSRDLLTDVIEDTELSEEDTTGECVWSVPTIAVSSTPHHLRGHS